MRIATYANFGTGDRHAVAEVLVNGKWMVLNWGRVAAVDKVDDLMRLRGFQLEGMVNPFEFRKWHMREWGGFLVPDGKGGTIPLKMGRP